MKAIFLNKSERNISRVYEKKLIEALIKKAGIDPETYSKEEVLFSPENFKEVKYIFSTWGMPTLTEEEIATCLPSLEAVFYSAGTVQAFARPFLNRGIKVFSAWAANAVPVAEYTVAQIILANKGFYQSSRIAKTGDYNAASAFFHANSGNYEVKIGIIGAGMIGKLVINMLKNYHLEVLVFDPFLPDEKAKELGVTKCPLDTLFKECRVVSNHLANNNETKGMLKGEHFASMLPYSTFINTGRGAQVVEEDLINVLKVRSDVTAVLDVTMPEPPPKDSEFYTLDNCILTPHIAGSSGNEVQRMGVYMKEEFENFIENKPCKYEVTLDMLKTMA